MKTMNHIMNRRSLSTLICLSTVIAIAGFALAQNGNGNGNGNDDLPNGNPFQVLQEQITIIQNNVYVNDQDITGLEQTLESAVADIIDLQTRMEAAEARIEQLQADVAGNSGMIQDLQQQIDELRAEMYQKVGELVDLIELTRQGLQQQIDELQATAESHQAQIDENRQRIDELRADLDYYIGVLRALEERVDHNEDEIAQLHTICIDLQNQINQHQNLINDLFREINDIHIEISKLWQAIDELAGRVKYLSAAPNTNVSISQSSERIWLFFGTVHYECGHCGGINARLFVDGSQAGYWRQGGCYHNAFTFNFVKLQVLPAGNHTVRFDYDTPECNAQSATFVGISF